MKTSVSVRKCATVRGFLLLLAILFMGSDNGYCAERIYYSIHLASFKNLQNANAHVNSLKEKGKMFFWKEADVPGKGRFFRVYIGKYEDKAEALEFWKKLDKEGAVSYRGIHQFKETIEPRKVKKPPLPKEKEPPCALTPMPIKDRFVDNQDGTITDRMTNLMWIKNGWRIDFISAVTWEDAMKRCENFRHSGYSDWRLPSLKEWKSVVDTSKECPSLVEPNPFENIITHMPYWSHTEFDYGAGYSGTYVRPVHAYTVMLYFGRIGHQNKNKRAFILPVRFVRKRGRKF